MTGPSGSPPAHAPDPGGRNPVVTGFEVRPPGHPDGHWMNRFWGPLSRAFLGTAIRLPVYRFVLRPEPGAEDLLASDRPLLFACVHQDVLDCYNGLPRVMPRRRLAAMVSHSRDGALAAGLLQQLGYDIVRGSSSRGGAEGILGLRGLLRSGTSVLMAADGPKAPLGDVKAGIVKLAAGSGAPILPVRAWGAARYRFRRSWSRATVTIPLLPVAVRVGAPIVVPEEVEDPRPWQIEISRSIARLATWTACWADEAPVAPYRPL